MRTKSFRRHHKQRMKDKFFRKQRLHPYWGLTDAKTAGQYSNCKANCSCWMCGNPRKWLNELTREEEIANIDIKQQLEEMNNVN